MDEVGRREAGMTSWVGRSMSATITLGLFVGRIYSGYPAPLPNVKWSHCGGRLDDKIHVGMFGG